MTTRQAVLLGWFLCGVLDIAAAFGQAWLQAGRGPALVLKGVASALWIAGPLYGATHGTTPASRTHARVDCGNAIHKVRKGAPARSVPRVLPPCLWMAEVLH